MYKIGYDERTSHIKELFLEFILIIHKCFSKRAWKNMGIRRKYFVFTSTRLVIVRVERGIMESAV